MRGRCFAALLGAPLCALALVPPPATALADSAGSVPFDAYIAGGDASCLEVSVGTGYSFIVEPDARLPRATAAISEGTSGAIAAPADPGDSVDALAGLMIPREEGQIFQNFPQGVQSAVTPVENEVNPHLEYPFEHASAAYPDPPSTSPQERTYLGAPNAAFSDPSNAVSVDGTAGDAKAGPLSASAEAGAGAAASVSMLGVSVGRVASYATAQVTDTTVSDDVSCTLQDLSVAPPGSGETLHVGSLVETLHTERALNGSHATETHSLQLADVTLDGKEVLPAGQGPITIPQGVPTSFTFPQLPKLPCPFPPQDCMQPPSLQSVTLSGTTASDTPGASGNEMTSAITAATVVIKSTAPVPSSIPPVVCSGNPPNPSTCGNPLSTTPATYTLSIASLDSTAYGLPSQSSGGSGSGGGSSAGGIPGVSGLAGGYTGGGAGSSFGGTPGAAGSAGKPVGASLVSIPGTPAALRWSVIAVAALLEALLLTSLFIRRRWLMSRRTARPAAARFLDLP
ncbi:MAG TPA: hypothetical protein VFA70_15855 [Dehalococcoidia bacterium]|nr:hypothetical protein [Dehalococcoidia bacterium]